MAVDGTKVLANASKHWAVSSQRAGELIEQLEGEIAQLLSKAEQADSTPLEEGLKIPEEIVRRQERKAKLAQGRREIEARAKAKEREKEEFELFDPEFLENRCRRFSYDQAGVEALQRL